ncbi:glycerol transporter [Tulasnella sp. 419]|nr:glycerol transporter [Tulasnella sp. 419]
MSSAAITIDMPQHPRAKLEQLDTTSDVMRRNRGIVALTVETPTSSRPPRQPVPTPSPPRWKTPEFLLYGIVFLVVVPLLVKIPVDLSSPTHPNFGMYQHRLSPGWIPGRQVDNSDRQYRSFRSNIPALALLACGHLLFSKAYFLFAPQLLPQRSSNAPSRIPFSLSFSILMLFALHGFSILKILCILSFNYLIGKSLRNTPVAPFATWAFNIAVLFMNEIYDGYRFGDIHGGLEFLDNVKGLHPRWNIGFNITVLRLISFNMDSYWACKNSPKDQGNPEDEKRRASTSHPLSQYTFVNYLAYAIYPPLYIAGPIMTFNNFMWQVRQPLTIPTRSVISYLVRFLGCLLTMELVLHYMYVVAMKDTSAWKGGSPAEISMIGFWNLIIVWLKLLIPWRFFRLWALADGIDAPENMVRCMANNYSANGFWRSWHRSYNLWVVRYIYIPVGGASRAVVSIFLVFTFVALWHDLSFRLLAWGWLVSLFIAPELLARRIFTEKMYGDKAWYRHLCAAGGVFNILLMMIANLIGFVIGTDGMKYLIAELFGTWKGLQFILLVCSCLFVAVHVMFEYRFVYV